MQYLIKDSEFEGLIAAHFSFNPFKNVSYPSAQKKKRISKIYEIISAY